MANATAVLKDEQWREFLVKVKLSVKEPYPILKLGATTYGFKDIINHFRDERGETGGWKKRSKATQEQYASRGKTNARYNPSNKLLQLTGNLRGTLLPTKGEIKREGKGALLFTTVPYAGRHNYGKNMPKREFMWLSGATMEDIAKLFLSKMTGEL